MLRSWLRARAAKSPLIATSDTDLIIDINGYFAPAGTGGLSLYAVQPCRVLDTRHVGGGQPFSGNVKSSGGCSEFTMWSHEPAQAYVFNATVVPSAHSDI